MFKLYSKNLNLLRLILKISKSIKQKKNLNEDNKINLYTWRVRLGRKNYQLEPDLIQGLK